MQECKSNVEIIGLCDVNTIKFEDIDKTFDKNWTEISLPEILHIPPQKLEVKNVDKIFVDVKIISTKVIPTHKTENINLKNKEGRKITGRKLIVQGLLKQKIIYTALVKEQSVHSIEFDLPFSTFIILNQGSLYENFIVDSCVEYVFIKKLSRRKIFKNSMLFLRARGIC